MAGSRPLGRWAFALDGVLAAGAAMAVGHVVAALLLPEASPVVAVSAKVIEHTPEGLKQWAIRRFGNADKAVLLGSVVAATTVIAAIAGMASRRRPRIGIGFVAALALVVVAAARTSTAVAAADAGPVASVLPGIAAALTAAAILLALRSLALNGSIRPPDASKVTEIDRGDLSTPVGELDGHAPPGGPLESPTDHIAIASVPGTVVRRRFLAGAAAVAGGSLVLGAVGQELAAPSSIDDLGRLEIDDPAPALPTGLDREVPGISPFRTPIRDFYRVDTALVVPRLDRATWRLKVTGDVDHELELSFDELVRDHPLIERDLTLNCVSNEVGGPYVSSGRWIGVRTRELLARAGVGDAVEQVLSRSADGMTISTPIRALTDGRDAMVAVALDGHALPRQRGYPARLLTPGLYGFVGATKWLVELRATTYDADTAYWTDRGWATDAPVKTQSRIDTPRGFARVPPGTIRVGGVAWAQRRGIARVELRVDGGEWLEATLGPEANVDYWRQWYCDVEITEPGRHDLTVRATDGTGQVQTGHRARPFPDGASGHASVSIRVV